MCTTVKSYENVLEINIVIIPIRALCFLIIIVMIVLL